MIYIVSGYRRSGTSCMMRCLHKGGIDALYAPRIENLNTEVGDYIPNPGGLWEVGRRFYTEPKFLRRIAAEKRDVCIKIMFDGLPYLARGDYTVLWMDRDPDEIEASLETNDARLRARGVTENVPRKPFDVYMPYSQADIDHVRGICEARSDIVLRRVWFRDLVQRPDEILRGLGLPIDVEKAASVVDKKYYRARKENATDESRGAGPSARSQCKACA